MSATGQIASPPARHALWAKLVIGLATLVALASSAPPRWHASEQRELTLVFEERDERVVIANVELAGKLYADVALAELSVWVTADRSASDLVLSVRPLGGADDPAAPEPPELPLTGDLPDEPTALTARPDVRQPNVIRLSWPLTCVEAVPRAESCSEQLEITLKRESQRPLSVELRAILSLLGSRETQPAGAFQLELVEAAP